MFRNSENWAIIIDCYHTEEQKISQLYDIWRDLYHVKMVEYYDYFSNLQWHIGYLEEKLHKSNPELSGHSINLDNSFISLEGFEDAQEMFNHNNEKLEKYLIDHIYILHDEIDQLADLIPKMLLYWKQLKVERLITPGCEVVTILVITHQGMLKYYSDTVYDQWKCDRKGKKLYLCGNSPDPILTLYHIDGNLPNDPDDSEDDYYEY